MIAVLRISGMVDVDFRVQETLHRIRLRRKYALTFLEDNEENRKLLLKVRDFVAYGILSKDVLEELIKKRAEMKSSDEKMDVAKIIKELESKPASEWSIKPFFRLHPPRGGIDSKKHFGVSSKAVLGDNKEKISDLIRRML